MDPVELWAQPNVAYRMRKIEGYAVRVEGLIREGNVLNRVQFLRGG